MTHAAAPLTTAPTAEQDTPQGTATKGGSSLGIRLEFLDALRGVAALAVVVEHFSEQAWPSFSTFTLERFRVGEFGVVLFFLCSGFIIPASMERRGSIRDFWIGRFFRLFPLYWASLGAIAILYFTNVYRGIPNDFKVHWLRYGVANLTMLQDFLGATLVLGQSWSLAYEMVFYLLVSVLFVAGFHRRSALLSACGLVLSATIGNRVASWVLKHPSHKALASLAVCLIVAAVLTLIMLRRKSVTTQIAGVFVILLITTLLFNRYEPSFQSFFFLGTMFFGTAMYRWTQGQISDRTMLLLSMLAVVCVIVAQMQPWSPWLNSVPITNYRFHQAEVITYLGAYTVFGVALLYRHLRFPRIIRYFGTISYSLYLTHSIVLYSLPAAGKHPVRMTVLGVALTVLVSSLTYRFIESPAISLGRRLTRRVHRTPAPVSTA